MLLGVRTPGDPWDIVLHGDPHPLTDRKRGDLFFKFWDPFIYPEHLKLQT